jgi:RNA polymerase sigma-70 factor (ECF subfamily)
MDHVVHLQTERPRLFAIAYRMLGTVSDAEDVLQDAYLRIAGVTDCETPEAMLTTIVVRLCLDHLKSARVQRETYVGPWLPEPLPTDEHTIDRDSVALAFLVLLEALTPAERAVYVLHEIFDYSHDEIGETLGKPAGTSRQLLRRARVRIGERRPRFVPAPEQKERVLATFFQACATGDVAAMQTLLVEDVRLTADGGGLAPTARKVVRGSDHVARFIVGLSRRVREGLTVEATEMNGALAVVLRTATGLDTITMLDLDESCRICRVSVVRNPEKLAASERVLKNR